MVLKSYWHMGFGTKLMKEALKFACNVAKVDVVSLQVRADNIHAIALYENWVLKILDIIKNIIKLIIHTMMQN